MKKFVAIYMAPTAAMDEMMKGMSKDQMKEGMAEWNTWMDAHKKNITKENAPLGKNKRITANGIATTRNEIGGYTVVMADSHDDAAKIFVDSPHLRTSGGYIDVLEVLEMDEM
jgi:hypothetical protein